MNWDDYLLTLYCLVDDSLKALPIKRLRRRGPQPTLADSEVITMELAGEYLGLDQDQAIYEHFVRHGQREFPAVGRVHRTTFVRQAANLMQAKQMMLPRRVSAVGAGRPGPPLWLFDSLPLPVCHFKRAGHCQRLAALASYGYDHTTGHVYYGVRLHLRCLHDGPAAQVEITPADVQDITVAPDLVPPGGGVGLGDRAYWSPPTHQQLIDQQQFNLLAPFKLAKHDPHPQRSRVLLRLRRVVETVIGQLVERYHLERTWARDRWHLCHRVLRKLLSHAACVLLNLRLGHPPLQIDRLVHP
jgi:hypothetical protein